MIIRANWLWLLILAIIAVAVLPAAFGVIAGVGYAVIYLLSLAVHPFIACRSCAGSGRRTGSLFGYTHRQCLSCGGQGRHRRLGSTVLYRGKQTWAEQRAEAARESRRNRPR